MGVNVVSEWWTSARTIFWCNETTTCTHFTVAVAARCTHLSAHHHCIRICTTAESSCAWLWQRLCCYWIWSIRIFRGGFHFDSFYFTLYFTIIYLLVQSGFYICWFYWEMILNIFSLLLFFSFLRSVLTLHQQQSRVQKIILIVWIMLRCLILHFNMDLFLMMWKRIHMMLAMMYVPLFFFSSSLLFFWNFFWKEKEKKEKNIILLKNFMQLIYFIYTLFSHFLFPFSATHPPTHTQYTFFCALSPDLHQEWANTYANILKPNGILITIIFPILPGKKL